MEPSDILRPDQSAIYDKLQKSIEKLDSFISAAVQSKGSGKIGYMGGRFVSSAFYAGSQWKVVQAVGSRLEAAHRKYNNLDSNTAFTALDKLADKIARLTQSETDDLDPMVKEKFAELKEKIKIAHDTAFTTVLKSYTDLQNPDAPSTQRHYLRCLALSQKFDYEFLTKMNVNTAEVTKRSRHLSKMIAAEKKPEAIKQNIDKEIQYIKENPESIKTLSREDLHVWKQYLSHLSKLGAKGETEDRNELFNVLLSVIETECPDLEALRARFADPAVVTELLVEENPANNKLIAVAIASGVLDVKSFFYDLGDKAKELNPKMVESLIRDLLFYDIDLDAKDPDGFTLLHLAVDAEKLPLVAQLLELGARIDIPVQGGHTVLEMGAELAKNENAAGQLLGSVIATEFIKRLGVRRKEPMDMTFDPTKMKKGMEALGTKGKKDKFLERAQELTEKGLETLEGVGSPISSAMGAQKALSKTQRDQQQIEAQIEYKMFKLGADDLTDDKLRVLLKEIHELTQEQQRLAGINAGETKKATAGLTETALDFGAEVGEALHLESLGGLGVASAGVKLMRNVEEINDETKKMKLIQKVIGLLLEEVEMTVNYISALERMEKPFAADLLKLKKKELDCKLQFLQREYKYTQADKGKKIYKTTLSVLKTGAKYGEVVFTPLTWVRYAATGLPYLTYLYDGVKSVAGLGKLKQEDFQPYNGTGKGILKKSTKRLGLKKQAMLNEALTENYLKFKGEETLWFEDVLKQAGLLDESKNIPRGEKAVKDYVLRYLID